MNTLCLNNALQACVIASYWESSLALACELNSGSLEYLAPDLVSSNLQLAALTMSHQWKHALHLLEDFPARGHQVDTSTYNTQMAHMALPSVSADGPEQQHDVAAVQGFREYLLQLVIESAWEGRKQSKVPSAVSLCLVFEQYKHL